VIVLITVLVSVETEIIVSVEEATCVAVTTNKS
jgi:hypothetical protein